VTPPLIVNTTLALGNKDLLFKILDFITNLKTFINIDSLNNYNNYYINKFIKKENKISINIVEFLILFNIDLYKSIIFINF
jgi:hypothetical protein